MFIQNDGREIWLFSKNKEIINQCLIKQFKYLLTDLPKEITEKFENDIILKIMNINFNWNKISDEIFIDNSGRINLQVWSENLDYSVTSCNIVIENNTVQFSEPEIKDIKDSPFYFDNAKGIRNFIIFIAVVLTAIIAILAGLYYLIKFLSNLF